MSDLMQSASGTCGCCAGLSSEVPGVIDNRPGLSQITYRLGRYESFKRTMLAALSAVPAANAPPLRPRFTSRGDTDFTVALIDAWATVTDILTFYEEQRANE